jgi:hypothetical protein
MKSKLNSAYVAAVLCRMNLRALGRKNSDADFDAVNVLIGKIEQARREAGIVFPQA